MIFSDCSSEHVKVTALFNKIIFDQLYDITGIFDVIVM